MLDTRIKFLASLYTAIMIIAVIVLLQFDGFKFKKPLVKGNTIQAIMVDISQLQNMSANNKSSKPNPQVKKPPVKKAIKPIPKPVKKDTSKPVIKEKPAIVPNKKKPKPKIDTKAQEKERKETLERQKKLKEIRKKRKAAEERRKIAEQNLKDLAKQNQDDTSTSGTPIIGSEQGTIKATERNQLIARYQLAVISAVERNWNKPAAVNNNLLCHVKVRQIPGGGVVDATISSPCNANEIAKKSILAAIKKADPLPYKGFEKVFERTAIFIFQPQD